MDEPQMATIGLTFIDESSPDPAMHARCWQIPLDIVDDIAASLTLRYGQPDEMIADPLKMARKGLQSAEEDGTVYMFNSEVPDG